MFAPAGSGATIIGKGSHTGLPGRLAIRYAVEGDLRFISHHDTLRLFERALARAGIPVRYSEGFNPRPRFSVVVPRPVGVASRDELMVLEVTADLAADEALRRLQSQMPEGLTLLSAETLAPGARRVPCEVWYRLEIEAATSTGPGWRMAWSF